MSSSHSRPPTFRAHHEHSDHAEHCSHDHSRDSSDIMTPEFVAVTEKERRHQVLKSSQDCLPVVLHLFRLLRDLGWVTCSFIRCRHLAADLSALLLPSSLPASDAHTFGLKRTESLAALFTASLMVLSIGLAIEAFRRLYVIIATPGEDQTVDGKLMATIAFIGVLVNICSAFVLGEDHAHMLGDHHGHSYLRMNMETATLTEP
ncbi:LOW QUALITY PROTEIN: hypothetical protein ACHAWO_008958 [Cyclotella atomus]|uniref:Cation efflux protein transmembrane domain-containing protein n=1 Tax=Cyclotella atomus TaxID=382360 RepID=A0ABD3QHI8_9STRA